MLEKEINKEYINILHWHIYSKNLICFFEYLDSFYKTEIVLDESIFVTNNSLNDNFIKNFILNNKMSEITLNEILSDEDTVMTTSPEFLRRVTPYIKKSKRNEKINKIIYGS